MNIIAMASSLSFIYPVVLGFLVLLPVIWYILRITPPAPRSIIFPAARFISGLIPDKQSHSKTPWWILLLRIMIIALTIIAMARPILNKSNIIPSTDGIRIVMDNGWASGKTWTVQKEKALEIIDIAQRENKELYILTTAPQPGQKKVYHKGPLSGAEAANIIRGLSYMAWPADYKIALETIKDKTADKQPIKQKSIHSYFLSSGIEGLGEQTLIKRLQNEGGISVLLPEDNQLPLIIKDSKDTTSLASVLTAKLFRAKAVPQTNQIAVDAAATGDKIIDRQIVQFDQNKITHEVSFDIAPQYRNKVQTIRIAGQNHSGAVLLFDNQNKRHNIAIIDADYDAEQSSLADASYYIERALAPYNDIQIGALDSVIADNISTIIMPDTGNLPPDQLDMLEKWIKEGGQLIRFAGPAMANSKPVLVPVPLRQGERALDGSMTWEKPLGIQEFSENSPLFGIDITEDILIKRHLLANPVIDISSKTWAQLDDGTPLITAEKKESGMLILIHTSAMPDWSDLPLSGSFVQILRRLVSIAGRTDAHSEQGGNLMPLLMLDEKGHPARPQGFEQPITIKESASIKPSSVHPPGIYGNGVYQIALNLGNTVTILEPLKISSLSIQTSTYDSITERDLSLPCLLLALSLFIADWILMIILHIMWRYQLLGSARRFAAAPSGAAKSVTKALILSAIMTGVILSAPYAAAQSPGEAEAKYANDLYLAYVPSGDPIIDNTAAKGLYALQLILTQRTSAEPKDVVALDIENDDLSFFPLIYWPIDEKAKPPSSKAYKNIQHYLDHGGTILFDTRDQISAPTQGIAKGKGSRSKYLQTVFGGLNVPPLEPIGEDHVLRRAYYLLDRFPGLYDGGILWVESQTNAGRDGVSSVIIGGHDWASAWLNAAPSGNGNYVVPNNRSQELALRFGINLMMYTLTGNYKNDQIHVQTILERLGQ